MFNTKKKKLVVAIKDLIESTIEDEIAQKMEAISELKKWQSQYVECEKCGVLVNKDKATPDTKLVYHPSRPAFAYGMPTWIAKKPTAKLVYYCQHCGAPKKTKRPTKKVDK